VAGLADIKPYIFGRLPGQLHVKGIGTKFNVIIPLNRTMTAHSNSLKETVVIPCFKDTPTGEIR
jgi:hypothetical protein